MIAIAIVCWVNSHSIELSGYTYLKASLPVQILKPKLYVLMQAAKGERGQKSKGLLRKGLRL